MPFTCGHCSKSHDTADEGRECAQSEFLFAYDEPKKAEKQPSEAQVNYAQRLLHERVPSGHALHLETTEGISAAEEYVNSLSKTEIGQWISGMVKHAPRREVRIKSGPQIQVEEGVYQKDGIYYKVVQAVHGSGHLYAKQWSPDSGKFEYTMGMLAKLRPEDKLDKESAAAFGRLYGVCMICGRTLTDEESIAFGIGPVCAKNWKA